MQPALSIETTADGSPTLYRSDIDEHYHSVKGAEAESRHVYIEAAWLTAGERFGRIRLFEVGFGTGLNAAMTAVAALSRRIPTEYYSVELLPLAGDTIDALTPAIAPDYHEAFRAVNQCEWDEPVDINPYFRLHKISGDFLQLSLPGQLNCIYYDAFSPEKQPQMWSDANLRRIHCAMVPGGVLTTYCAKGAIRRSLEHTGFRVERLPGPPGGKREILRATVISQAFGTHQKNA